MNVSTPHRSVEIEHHARAAHPEEAGPQALDPSRAHRRRRFAEHVAGVEAPGHLRKVDDDSIRADKREILRLDLSRQRQTKQDPALRRRLEPGGDRGHLLIGFAKRRQTVAMRIGPAETDSNERRRQQRFYREERAPKALFAAAPNHASGGFSCSNCGKYISARHERAPTAPRAEAQGDMSKDGPHGPLDVHNRKQAFPESFLTNENRSLRFDNIGPTVLREGGAFRTRCFGGPQRASSSEGFSIAAAAHTETRREN